MFRLHKGFTLIEIMISMAISVMLMTALIGFYVNVNRNNISMSESNEQLDSARFALQLLKDDIVLAGYWGSYIPPFDDLTYPGVPKQQPIDNEPFALPDVVPDPCKNYTAANWTPAHVAGMLGISIQAYDSSPCAVVADRVANSDVLVIRHASICMAGVGDCENYADDKLYFQESFSYQETPSAIPSEDCPVACLPGCAPDNQLFVLASKNYPDPPFPKIPPYNTPNTGVLDSLHKINCQTIENKKRKFISNMYWIRDHEIDPGDGIPTLMRSQFDSFGDNGIIHKPGAALIGGVESMRVELGIDSQRADGSFIIYTEAIDWVREDDDPDGIKLYPRNRGDGIPDYYKHCTSVVPCEVNELINVVAVRLYLLIRSRQSTPEYTDTKIYNMGSNNSQCEFNGEYRNPCTFGPYNDHYKRHVYSTSVRLINIVSRRDMPPPPP